MNELWKNETVALAMPVYDKVHHQAWEAHMKIAMRLGNIFPLDQLALFHIHSYPQPHAQNYLINGILKHIMPNGKRPDWILWVESDSCPPIDAFEILRARADPVERPVMHGISFDREPPYHPSIWEQNGQGIVPIHNWQPDKLYKIYHSGTCIVLFHTSVFDKLQRPWYRMQPFEPGCKGMIPCTSLSQRMHEAGVPIYAYTGCIAGHIAESPVIGPEISRQMYARTQKKESLIKSREYVSYDEYIEHQKGKTLRAKDGTCTELGDFDSRKQMFAKIFATSAYVAPSKANVLCLGSRRGEEVQAFIDRGNTAIGIDLVSFPPLVIKGDFHNLPFDNGDFDFVFSNSVDHVHDLAKFASEAKRVCRVGGRIMLHLSIGTWSDEMSLGLSSAQPIIDAFANCTVEMNEAMPEYGGGINHLLVLGKNA